MRLDDTVQVAHARASSLTIGNWLPGPNASRRFLDPSGVEGCEQKLDELFVWVMKVLCAHLRHDARDMVFCFLCQHVMVNTVMLDADEPRC